MTRPTPDRNGRGLHPVAWWLWALGLAAAASRTTDPLLLGLVVAVTAVVVAARRSATPWARAYRGFLILGLVVVGIRVLGATLVGSSTGTTVIAHLPEPPLPGVLTGIHLGGTVTAEGLAAAAGSGLQLATILACAGAANTLAHPLRLLRTVPTALYEVGVAVVVAVSAAPSLLAAAARVRTARRLRGRRTTGLRALGQTAVPVLHGALERSLALAASMDARGYGRRRPTSVRARSATGGATLAGLLGVLVGLYGLLHGGTAPALGAPVLAVGILGVFSGLALGGRASARTRYRPDPWTVREWAVALSGILAAAGVVVTGAHGGPGAAALMPAAAPLALPGLPLVATAGILLAALPAGLAPVATPAPVPTPAPMARPRAEVAA